MYFRYILPTAVNYRWAVAMRCCLHTSYYSLVMDDITPRLISDRASHVRVMGF